MARCTPVVLIAALASAASALAQPVASPPHAAEELIGERPTKDFSRDWWDGTIVSSDLGKVVWRARNGVVVNGQPLGSPADELVEPALSPDGQHVLSAGRVGKAWFVWLDGQPAAMKWVLPIPPVMPIPSRSVACSKKCAPPSATGCRARICTIRAVWGWPT